MTQFWKVLAACALTPPVVLAAQEPAAPPSEHEQHEQRQRLMGEHMESMQRHRDMMHAMHSQEPDPGRCAEGEAPALTR